MHKFKKQYGQNFLTDPNLLEAIADDAVVNKDDVIIEVGAGMGALTEVLARRAKKVISFEIDADLESALRALEKKYNNLQVIMGDFLNFDFSSLKIEKFKVVSNLPYYITTVIITKFLKLNPISMTLMVQKEVGLRLSASPKSSVYGAMSVICQNQAKVTLTRIVKREMFTPAPEVDSALVRFDFFGNDYDEDFAKFVFEIFALKRKTLVNNLKKMIGQDKTQMVFDNFNLNPSVRAEELSPEEIYKIFTFVENM